MIDDQAERQKIADTKAMLEQEQFEAIRFDQEHRFADKQFDAFIAACRAVSIDDGGAGFCLTMLMVRWLAECGWTADELCRDVRWHVEHQLAINANDATVPS